MRALLLPLVALLAFAPGAAAQWDIPLYAEVEILQPAGVERIHGARQSAIGLKLRDWEQVQGLARVVGTPGDSTELGCGAIADDVLGRVALLRRGGCSYTAKALRAAAAGAVALLVYNDVEPGSPADTALVLMAGDSAAVAIPVAFTRAATAALLRALGDAEVRVAGSFRCFDYSPEGADPIEPWRYYPLAIGDAWEYKYWGSPHIQPHRERIDAVADTVLGDRRYVRLRVARYAYQNPGPPIFVTTRLVRFDTTTAQVIYRGTDGVESSGSCPLDASGGLVLNDCDEFGSWRVYVAGPVRTYYSCSTGFADVSSYAVEYTADRGLTRAIEYPPFTTFFHAYDIVYSRVNGVEIGTPVVVPVAGEEGAPSAAATLRVYPSPAGPSVTVAFALPAAGEAVVEVLDVLGRRVARLDLGRLPAGPGEAALDVRALAPGRYAVRLLGAGEARLVAPLVVAR